MKTKFLNIINWKLFIKYETIALIAVSLLYAASKNKFPENIGYLLAILFLWSFMVLLYAYSSYYLQNNVTNRENLTYKKEKK